MTIFSNLYKLIGYPSVADFQKDLELASETTLKSWISGHRRPAEGNDAAYEAVGKLTKMQLSAKKETEMIKADLLNSYLEGYIISGSNFEGNWYKQDRVASLIFIELANDPDLEDFEFKCEFNKYTIFQHLSDIIGFKNRSELGRFLGVGKDTSTNWCTGKSYSNDFWGNVNKLLELNTQLEAAKNNAVAQIYESINKAGSLPEAIDLHNSGLHGLWPSESIENMLYAKIDIKLKQNIDLGFPDLTVEYLDKKKS